MKKIRINPIIYSYTSFMDDNVNGSFVPEYIRKGNSLWIASYLKDPEKNLPKLPQGWSDWKVWQFTDKGKIVGYTGDIDLNVMKLDYFNTH